MPPEKCSGGGPLRDWTSTGGAREPLRTHAPGPSKPNSNGDPRAMDHYGAVGRAGGAVVDRTDLERPPIAQDQSDSEAAAESGRGSAPVGNGAGEIGWSVGFGANRLSSGGTRGTTRTSTYATNTMLTMKKLVGSRS